jgi:hypothetical protein
MIQSLFTVLTSLFHRKRDLLKARVVIYAYEHHLRLLSPEPVVVKQPKFTRVEEPTLLWNHLLGQVQFFLQSSKARAGAKII